MLRCFNLPALVIAAACGAAPAAAGAATPAATQQLTIEAVDAQGAVVNDAVCDIANRLGSWRVVTPAVAQITPGGEWLKVKCAKGLDLAGASTSIDTTQLSPRRASAMPGALRELGGTPAVKVRVVMRDAPGSAPKPPDRAEHQIVQAAPVPSFISKPLALSPTAPVLAASASAAHPLPPPAAGAADVHDVRAVPYLSGAGREAYFDFLRYPQPRAFAISRNGGWGFGVRGTDPRKMALDNCERRSGPCQLYAFNQQVVLAVTDTQ